MVSASTRPRAFEGQVLRNGTLTIREGINKYEPRHALKRFHSIARSGHDQMIRARHHRLPPG